jgi:hypothetical protein
MIQTRNGKKAWLYHARTIPASARVMGLYLLAGRGSGKSRFMGRVIALQDFMRGIPQVIIDPVGGTIDNFLDKVARFLQYVPKSQHYRFWQRIRYVDFGSKDYKDYVVPFPLYYRLGTEQSLLDIAERYLQVILKSNPSLLNAQVQGIRRCIKSASIPAWHYQVSIFKLPAQKACFATLRSIFPA